jgi:hypothetical protein
MDSDLGLDPTLVREIVEQKPQISLNVNLCVKKTGYPWLCNCVEMGYACSGIIHRALTKTFWIRSIGEADPHHLLKRQATILATLSLIWDYLTVF